MRPRGDFVFANPMAEHRTGTSLRVVPPAVCRGAQLASELIHNLTPEWGHWAARSGASQFAGASRRGPAERGDTRMAAIRALGQTPPAAT